MIASVAADEKPGGKHFQGNRVKPAEAGDWAVEALRNGPFASQKAQSGA